MKARPFGWPPADRSEDVAIDLSPEPSAAARKNFDLYQARVARFRYGGASYHEAVAIMQFLVWAAGGAWGRIM